MKLNRMRYLAVVAGFMLAGSGLICQGAGIRDFTKPSKDVTLSCSRPGLIAEVLVKEGDQVKQEQPVVQEDDREEAAQLASDKAKAEDETRVKAQEALWEQKKVDLTRLEWADKNHGTSPYELDQARVAVVVAKAQVDIEKFDQQQAITKFQQTKALVDKMRVLSPIDGVVAQTMTKKGESVDLSTKVIRIVNIDPLWVEVKVPLQRARELKKDSAAQVTFSDKSTRMGNVTFISPAGDPGSATLMVRVEVANPELRPSGEAVEVDFAAGAKMAEAGK